jgi:hypothetical protein
MSAGVGRPLVVAGADLAVLLLSLSLALGFVHPLGNPRATTTEGHRFAGHDAAGARHDFRRSAIEVEPRRDLDRLPESFRPLSDRRLTTRFQGATSAASNARTRLANSSGFRSETSQWAMPRRCQWAR